MIDPKHTVLWSAATPVANQSTITLSDSIDNYDEIIYYGSGARNTALTVSVKTEYPVLSGVINGGGPFYWGKWGIGDSYLLCNGTQVFLSGNSGGVFSSYFWGKNNGNTNYTGSLANNRTADVRPYKIEGVKYSTSDDRTLLWSSTGNPYNTNISLSESITGFTDVMVYGSGTDGSAHGFNVSKQVYRAQSGIIACEPWCYSPWTNNYRCNYVLGCNFLINGNSGHVGSSWFMGINRTNTAWAAGKWTDTNAPKMMVPYAVYGLNRK